MTLIDMEFHVLFKDQANWHWWDHADANDVEELVAQYKQNETKQIVRVNYVDGTTAYIKRSE